MSDLTQEEVVTLSALKAAAKVIPERPAYLNMDIDAHAHGTQYERARAEFWRLAYQWERRWHARVDAADHAYISDLEGERNEACRLIAEVESST